MTHHLHMRMLGHRVMRYAGITLGCLIASSAINLFLVPAHLLTGGATGIAMIVYYLFGLPIGLQTFVYNIPLLFMAWKLMGRAYTVDIIIGTAIFSFLLDLTRPLNAYAPVNDMMLTTVYGGVFAGLGYGLVFRMNGSTGGFDILAAIVRKYYDLHMGGVLFSLNCLIMLIAAFLFGMAPAMFTLIYMFINATMVDKIVAGFSQRKAVLIVSDRRREIAESIIDNMHRGVTFLHGQGAYTRRERNVVFVCVGTTQVGKLKFIVHNVDPHAFVIIMSANEVMGRGFGRINQNDAAASDENAEDENERR